MILNVDELNTVGNEGAISECRGFLQRKGYIFTLIIKSNGFEKE